MEEAGDNGLLARAVRELERFVEAGSRNWRAAGLDTAWLGELPAVASELAKLEAQEAEGDGNLDALNKAIEAAIKAAAASLTGSFPSVALDYLGFTDTADKPACMSKRREDAAERLKKSERWFRKRCSKHPYNGMSPASWIIAQIAIALMATERDPPSNVTAQKADGHVSQLPTDSEDDLILQDVHEHYRRTPRADLRTYGFFERESTTGYIEDIAQLANDKYVPITIYAGISADAGNEPRRRQFMERLLSQLLQQSDLVKEAATENDRKSIAERVSHIIGQTYAPSYLGSIVRELTRRGSSERPPSAENLRSEIGNLLAAGTVPGRFAARAIAASALAMRRAGASVNVITSNYDDVLAREVKHIHLPSYLPVKEYRFVTINIGNPNGTNGTEESELGSTEVGFTQLNGSLESPAAPLILGEGDFFAEYGADLRPTDEHSSWRQSLLTRLLEQTTCIFVGSTLTDPDVLERLVRTKHRQRRYALLLQPTFETPGKDMPDAEHTGKSTTVGSLEHYVGRELVTQRFLHLGVVPIIVEHPHQLPQLLREIALKILQGDKYRSYNARTRDWWDYWAKAFGHKPPNGPPGPRSVGLQEHWRAKPLAQAMKHLDKVIAEDKRPKLEDERLLLEVWLRNPYERDLVLWARSDSHWLNAATVRRGSLRGHGGEYIAQDTFQQGRSERGRLLRKGSQWLYVLSIPLVLSQEPWCHLPVGVLNVMSNKAEDERDDEGHVTRYAKLLNIADPQHSSREAVERLEKNLKKIVLRELDPQSKTWTEELPEWETYIKRRRNKR
jgi:hypothetical protein